MEYGYQTIYDFQKLSEDNVCLPVPFFGRLVRRRYGMYTGTSETPTYRALSQKDAVQEAAFEANASPIPVSIVSNSSLLKEGLPTLLHPYIGLELIATYSGELVEDLHLPALPGHVAVVDSNVGPDAAVKWT